MVSTKVYIQSRIKRFTLFATVCKNDYWHPPFPLNPVVFIPPFLAYLPSILLFQSILQKFVDDLFNSLFSVSHPPSSPTGAYSAFFPQSPGVQVHTVPTSGIRACIRIGPYRHPKSAKWQV